MKFDKYMHDSLHELAQDVSPNPMLRARVMNEVQLTRTKTRPRRMRFAVAAAAMLCVLVGGAFAAGPIVGLASTSYWGEQVTDFDEQATVEKQAGFTVRLPETLNGAAFSSMEAVPIDAIDADGNTAYSYQEFDAYYQDGNTMPFLMVTENKNIVDDGSLSDKTLVDTREINGITVTYREIPTIFLPPDGVEPTAEEQAAADRGECFISYGSQERIDGVYHTISWVDGDLNYSIGSRRLLHRRPRRAEHPPIKFWMKPFSKGFRSLEAAPQGAPAGAQLPFKIRPLGVDFNQKIQKNARLPEQAGVYFCAATGGALS